MKKVFSILLSVVFLLIIFVQFNCVQQQNENDMSKEAQIERGKYLVNAGGCGDCHTPKIFTAHGMMFDTTKALSGHIAGTELPLKELAGVKRWMSTTDLTAWVGPWGISYSANLTPDDVTGIGNWTADVFIKSMRTGKHMGVGRQLLPPMPYEQVAKYKDEDLKAIFSYLETLKPIRNKVPDPVPPPQLAELMKSSK